MKDKAKKPDNNEIKELLRLARRNCKHEFEKETFPNFPEEDCRVEFICIKCEGWMSLNPYDNKKGLYYKDL